MVALDPESEVDEDHGMRWSWKETMRQLRYRYVFFSFSNLEYANGKFRAQL